MKDRTDSAITILDNLPRGVTGKDIAIDSLRMSEFANSKGIWQSPGLRPATDKFLLGRKDCELEGIDKNDERFLCDDGRAGSALNGIGGSAIYNDPKGEMASIVGEYLAEELGQKVYVLDPFRRAAPGMDKNQAAFNPLALLRDNDDIFMDAGLIADGLVVKQSKSGPHPELDARNLVGGLIRHVATFLGVIWLVLLSNCSEARMKAADAATASQTYECIGIGQ